MRIALPLRLFTALFGFLLLIQSPVLANESNDEMTRLLPDTVGDLRALKKVDIAPNAEAQSNEFEKVTSLSRSYRSADGGKFDVTIVKTRSDRGAYALFSNEIQKLVFPISKADGIGTFSVIDSSNRLLIYKGLTFVTITDGSRSKNADLLLAFARQLTEPLDRGEGEIPVLIKHLPDWEQVLQRSVYAVSLPSLQVAAGNRPVLEVVSFTSGTEAVTATYGPSRLVIIEHTTPQLASDYDARINTRIGELKSNGQPAPTSYRRVGNYSVFVFDAPDEASAVGLIDKIAYEQVVQWLGNNPRWLERAEREYRQTTAGVILAVFKASGLSLLICLAIGGIFGTIVFRRRRAQQSIVHSYSDAGGMLRLNIDEMTPKVDGARLLGKGDV